MAHSLSLTVTVCLQASPEQRVIQELEVENILAALPAFPRGAPLQRARRAAQALSRAANYSVLMAQQQVGVLRGRKERRRETDSQLYWLICICLAPFALPNSQQGGRGHAFVSVILVNSCLFPSFCFFISSVSCSHCQAQAHASSLW